MTQSISGAASEMNGSVVDDPSLQPTNGANGANGASGGEDALLAKLLAASNHERSGEIEQAVALYQEIVAVDGGGTWGQSAKKALEAIAPEVLATTDDRELAGSDTGADQVSRSTPQPAIKTSATTREPETQPPRATHLFNRAAKTNPIASLRWKVVGATVLPAVAVSLVALWWLPRDLEQRWAQTSAAQEDTIAASEVRVLLQRQRQFGVMVGVVSAVVGLVLAASGVRSLRVTAQFLVRQASAMVQGKDPDHPQLKAISASEDVIGKLARTISLLGQSLRERDQQLADSEYSKRTDLESATRETRRLQQQVIELLVQIEEVRSGNLTARAPTVDGKVGSIADAFNATIDSLRYIVTQVVKVTQSLTQGVKQGEASVRQVSDSALQQSETLKAARQDVALMVDSIQQVSDLTQSSAQIARDAIDAAHDGDVAMERTVVSMDKIRTAVSNTSKRAKRLAESAQEVSQILAIVTGISEQANLLAFNASIEAARAGEQGQGFRQVSDEVRNLASQVSEAAQDIERLVQSIQEETASVIDVLEAGTSEVVSGTQLVSQTQKTLSQLTALNREIDTALQQVAANTGEQTETSQQVNRTMESVADVSLANAESAQEVVDVLEKLLREVSTLQTSVDRFQV